METLIFSHNTALNAIRSTRTWRGEISWRPCTPEEQRRALATSTARLAALDLQQLRSLGVISDAAANPGSAEQPEAIHILVNSSNRRAHWKGCVPHVSSTNFPANSLRRVTQGIYVPCPELLFIQMAAVLDFAELLVLGLELMGLYTLKPSDEDGFAPCEAAMTEDSLTRHLERARGLDGIKQARRALPYLLERSRSPMETAMALMFSLPRCHGGFGCGKPQLNHTIKLSDKAREACGRAEIECDAYYKEACIDLEYNSAYHNNEKQRQLDTVSAIYDVEKLLFTAHEKQDNAHLALEKIGYITSARGVAFLVTGRGVPASFLWAKRREQAHPLWSSQLAACLESHFAQGRDEVSAESPEELRELFPGVQLPPIRNLLALPVTDMDGIQCGILTAVDMEDFRSGAPALRSVSFSFSMFCHNLLLYNHLVKQSQTDALTGLKNRNRYEQDLPELNHAFRRSLACVYVDANGLHELNNTEGHAAGDSMLRTIAARLLVCFESPYTYRIGGDEFVALIPDLKAGEVERLCRGLTEELAAEHIHVSSGFAWASGDLALPELIKRAEEDMYAKKAAFYQRKTDGRRQSRKSAPRP